MAMERRNPVSVAHCPPSADQPNRLLGELQEAKTAPAMAEYYLSFRYSHRHEALFSAHHFCVAHEAVWEARNAIDQVIEMLRIEATETLAARHATAPEVN
ncbi:MAG: hypothetical protein JO287_03655 [Pseudonocardiales bacterium]|nr:hypothetical protein [Pseudonocardiales bacterium]